MNDLMHTNHQIEPAIMPLPEIEPVIQPDYVPEYSPENDPWDVPEPKVLPAPKA